MAQAGWKYIVSLSLVLVSVWLLWSGHTDAFLLSMGGLSCLFVVLVSLRMGILDGEAAPV